MTTPSSHEAMTGRDADVPDALAGSGGADPAAPPAGQDGAAAGGPDWHALAALTPVVAPRRRRAGPTRNAAVPGSGQLSFGELPGPATRPASGNDAVSLPGPPQTTALPGTSGGVLIAGRFPETLPPTPARRPRPGDWTSLGVTPTMRPFELPAPAVPDDVIRDRTLPVESSQVLERRLVGLRAGQTIEVEPGEYRGTLTIRTPVTLRAIGGEVRIRSTTGPAVVLKGCGATLIGLNLRSDHGEAVVVESPAGRGGGTGGPARDADRLELEDCRVNAAGSGVDLRTALVRLGVERCAIVVGDGAAIRLPEGGVAAVADSDLVSFAGPGISGGDAVTLAMAGSTVSGCGGAGVRLGERARLWMDEGEPSAVTDNRGSGIALGPGSTGTIAGASLTGNGGWGLIAPGGDVVVRGGTLSGNALGDRKYP